MRNMFVDECAKILTTAAMRKFTNDVGPRFF